VCAAHCGYRPLEINASDDRGGAALQARIQDAVEMQSVMGERRPNCVIIDEIDGATGGRGWHGEPAVALLLPFVQYRLRNKTPHQAA
jgi:chromosome transmission fidelity protein 18